MTKAEIRSLHTLYYRELGCKVIVDTLGFKLGVVITKLLMPAQTQTAIFQECSFMK